MTIHADAHVHFYRCFDLLRLLRAARDRARSANGTLLLLLCESQGYDYFAALRGVAMGASDPLPGNLDEALLREFPPALTGEAESLRLGEIVLVAGRQRVSRESIEVLALAEDPAAAGDAPSDGALPARDLLLHALEADAVAVLPWGVGKWLGERGRRVAALLRDPVLREHPRFFVGDIAQRCWPWSTPAAFASARVLAGSDILPVPGAEARLARYGLRLEAPLDPLRPAESLRRALCEATRVETWGRREGLVSTLAEQLRYRVRGGDA